MKAAIIQLDIKWEDKEANLLRIEEFIEKASGDKCDIAVLPEMCTTGFSMNIDVTSESKNGPSILRLAEFAKKYNINIIAGLVEESANIAAVFDREGNTIAKYAKNHLFELAGEDKVYTSGTDQEIFKLDDIPSSVFICYDLRFPEIFRKVAKEVSVIYLIANWPAIRQDHWDALLKARAIENQCFILGVNRTGFDGNNIEYSGGSALYSPNGELLYNPGVKEYSDLEFDIEIVKKHRLKYPFL